MAKYKLEVISMGELYDEFETNNFETAKKFYMQNYNDAQHSAVVTYVDGERIKTPEAWNMFLGKGFQFMQFKKVVNENTQAIYS